MQTLPEPAVGSWYNTSADETFEVVAYDEDEQTIEVQYYDGTVEEFDMETWLNMELTEIEAPQDLSGAFDDLDHEIPKEEENDNEYGEGESLDLGEWSEGLDEYE